LQARASSPQFHSQTERPGTNCQRRVGPKTKRRGKIALVVDPVTQRFVDSLARPAGRPTVPTGRLLDRWPRSRGAGLSTGCRHGRRRSGSRPARAGRNHGARRLRSISDSRAQAALSWPRTTLVAVVHRRSQVDVDASYRSPEQAVGSHRSRGRGRMAGLRCGTREKSRGIPAVAGHDSVG
jgi:hypothetical protein